MATQKRSTKPKRTKAVTARTTERMFETDGTYFLKLVVFVLLGTLWLKFQDPVTWLGIPLTAIPVGLLLGLVLVRHFEKMQSDRKIWYAILLVVTIICYFVPAGIVI
jgi:NhaP-type Na+/H+ or K+/H+ antiporter